MKKYRLGIFTLWTMMAVPYMVHAYTTDDFVEDFEWMEPNNTVEVAVGESYQLHYKCSYEGHPVFSDFYKDDYDWVYYSFSGGQHVIYEPLGYSIDKNGVLTGLQAGSWAIKPTGLIQRKDGKDVMLRVNVVPVKGEKEPNNTMDLANEFTSKIEFCLDNEVDIDYFKFKHNKKFGEYVYFKVNYLDSYDYPVGLKWSTFSGGQSVGGGSLMYQGQICKALVVSGDYVYIEFYFNSSFAQYFRYYEYFSVEVVDGEDKPQEVAVTNVSLDAASLTLTEGETQTLTATVLPDNATNKKVSWSSSNDAVVSVDQNGAVTAVKEGTATISVTTEDGGKTASCEVTVKAESVPKPDKKLGPKMIIHKLDGEAVVFYVSEVDSVEFVDDVAVEYVDLGLSVMWATCNIGAESESEIGERFAWGEIETKDSFTWSSYKWYNSNTFTKYNDADGLTVLEPCDDVASARLGENWRMPTKAEMQELINNCTWTEKTLDGTQGYEVTGPNGNIIFMPCSGQKEQSGNVTWEDHVYLWSSECREEDYAIRLAYGDTFQSVSSSNTKKDGLCVRAVYEVKKESRHEYIDLGLPRGTLWATCNVGAENPEDYGDYYAWGETETKESFDWSNYKWSNGSKDFMTKYCTKSNFGAMDGKIVLDIEDDVAHVKWGGKWRMPTKEEMEELWKNCKWERTKQNGVNGYKVIGPNGSSIFFPAAGHYESRLDFIGERGSYRTSTMYFDSWLDAGDAWYLNFSDYVDLGGDYRFYGESVRPVWGESKYIEAESVTISSKSIELEENSSATLEATVAPSTATYTTISWSSSNTNVATVDQRGVVTAIKAGTTTITATSKNGKQASCELTVKAKSNPVNEHEYVDLGLPSGLLWATCNVGAENPEDYGDYYAWGETETKGSYNWSTYKWCNGSGTSLTKYCTISSYGTVDKKIILDPEDDVAHVRWGGNWRMPTMDEQNEFRTECTWKWTQLNGVNGYKVIGPNGNSIFLPAAGYRYDGTFDDVGSYGYYWSGSLVVPYTNCAYDVDYGKAHIDTSNYRYYGWSVRPVCAE